jgi:hypothetical protein
MGTLEALATGTDVKQQATLTSSAAVMPKVPRREPRDLRTVVGLERVIR